MFIALTLEKPAEGLLARGLERLRRGPLGVERRNFRGSGYSLIIDRTAGSPHWERLERLAGRSAARLVAPEGVEPPPGSGLRLYQPWEFWARLTAAAGVQTLEGMGEEGRRAQVGLVDEEGRFPWCAGELARRCALVRVLTRRPDRYEEPARRLMEEWGATLVPASSPGELRDCAFAVSPAPTGVWRLPAPVFTVDRSGIQGEPTINRLEPELPPGLREEIPPGLPPALFLGTAWEAGLRRFPLEPVLRECRIGGRRAGMEEAAALILLGRREPEEEKGGIPGKNGGTEPALLP